jgi:thiol:disulfide interchange protein
LLLADSPLRGDEPDKSAETTPQAESTADKAEREPIYNPEADATADIAAAVDRAARDNKRVIVKWGGNWCGWCYRLHDFLHDQAEIAPVVRSEYEIVHVDVNNNRELLKEYDKDDICAGYPFVTVLDQDGKLLTNQNTAELEEGKGYNAERVMAFLKEWTPEPLNAEKQLTAALAQAREEDKRVLVHLGAPWCGWCGVLERFLEEHASIIEQDYVDLKIDLDRMEAGKEIGEKLRKERSGGIPWMVILDADGEELVASEGPQGNIGYPYQPHEIEHFMKMLRETSARITAEQFAQIEVDLKAFREERERKQAAESK